MSLSDSKKKDPSMLGTSGYERKALDFYPTPDSAIDSLLGVIEDDLPSLKVWEPCCGDGAISKRMGDAISILSTDIVQYPGFEYDERVDFMRVVDVADLADIKGFIPDAIITNPPYGDEAAEFARHAIRLMESQKGIVMFLCRHEWDCAQGRDDLFNHPAFAMKITLQHRPRWIAGSKGAPRHNYAWFIWNWQKPALAAPELRYVR